MSDPPEAEAPETEEQPYKPVSRWFIFFMLRTRRGLSLMDTLGRWRVTKPLAWVMLALIPFAGALALYVIAVEVHALYFTSQGPAIASSVRTISPLANFLLPGLNPYLPLSVWLAVIVAVVIHEASHGIVARSLGLKIKSAGVLLLLILPVGAFVETDDKQLKESRSRDTLRVLGAGSGINFIVGIACVLLLILTVSAMTPAVKGAGIVGVVPDSPTLHSPAAIAGIQPGDFITAINNSPVTDLGILRNGSFTVGESVNLTIWRSGQIRTIDNVVLSNYTVTTVNETSGQSTQTIYPFLGVDQASYASLQATANTYAGNYKTTPIAYLVEIPTFGQAQYLVPFSTALSGFYTSPLGALTPAVTLTLYWMFFVNFNLAIFNSLPIYPMDGGQAFETFLRGAGRGRISDVLARRVTTGVTLAIFFALFAVIAGPYISGAFPPY
ncbi:MAG TPA: site-2 protease family protein [Nitrososphaerales archaeon]|nr:site-2 protease family protein [Nitrososphaerales archaeon]